MDSELRANIAMLTSHAPEGHQMIKELQDGKSEMMVNLTMIRPVESEAILCMYE